MKKLFNILIALFMVFGLATPVHAEPKSTGVITIKNDPSVTSVSMIGHTYGAYKVLDLTVSGPVDDQQYSYTVDEDFKTFFQTEAAESATDVSTDILLNSFANDYITNGDLTEISKKLMIYIEANAIVVEKTSGEPVDIAGKEIVSITGLPLGYYLVLDNGGGEPGGPQSVIAATALGSTDTELVINLKAAAPTVDKEILNNDDNTWGPAGDNQIGDDVNYRITSTIPDTTGYDNYTYIIHDRMTTGLTFKNDIEIYVGNKDIGGVLLDPMYYTVEAPAADGDTFDITVDILTGITDGVFAKGDKLFTYFTATLNEDALIAGDSNDNGVDLEYSNNPNDGGAGTTTTPEVVVKDYTFELNITKENAEGTPLEGAEFEVSNAKGPIYFNLETLGDGTNKYVVCTEHTDEAGHIAAGTCTKTIISGTNGKFQIVGLDDLIEYTLTETKPPAGYNAIDPIKFTITAIYDDATGEIVSVSVMFNGELIQPGDGIFELGTTIVDTSGNELPETGGMGTKVFTVLGIVLVVFAVVILVSRYRAR